MSEKITIGWENNNYFVAYCQYLTPALREVLRHPDYLLDHSTGPFFKSDLGDTTTIGVIIVDNRKLVVKRYNIKSFWHFLKKCWRSSNAMRTWKNAHYLKQLNIDTVNPVAVIEQRLGRWLRSKAYFISEYVENNVRGCDYFGKDAQPIPPWAKVVANVSIMVKKMRDAHIEHRDFQYGNLLIVGEQPLLLDLDHMKISIWWQQQNNNHSCSGCSSDDNCDQRRCMFKRMIVWALKPVFERAFEKAFRKDLEHFLEYLKSNPAAYKMFTNAFSLDFD